MTFILKALDFIGANWKFFAAGVALMIAFGWGYKVRGDRCDRDMRIAVEMFQAKANEMGTRFEQERNILSETKRRVYAKKPKSGDCLITADKLPAISAALENDTSKLD